MRGVHLSKTVPRGQEQGQQWGHQYLNMIAMVFCRIRVPTKRRSRVALRTSGTSTMGMCKSKDKQSTKLVHTIRILGQIPIPHHCLTTTTQICRVGLS